MRLNCYKNNKNTFISNKKKKLNLKVKKLIVNCFSRINVLVLC